MFILAGCGDDAAEPPVTTSNGPQVPASLEGLWLLEDTELFLDIRLATATVDGRTNCARLLGSLTAGPDGVPTSFSLPGRDTTGCTISQRRSAERLTTLLESVSAARAEPGGYVLLDATNSEIGRLLIGS